MTFPVIPQPMWVMMLDRMRHTRLPILIRNHPRFPIMLVWMKDPPMFYDSRLGDSHKWYRNN